jgi:hypothetical protein
MSLLYAFITLIVVYVLKGMNKDIDELLKFINYNDRTHKKTKRQDKQKEDNMKEGTLNSAISEKNESL